METEDVLRPLGLFAVVVFVLLIGTVIVSLATLGAPAEVDTPTIQGQSPSQFQPESVAAAVAREGGRITIDGPAESKRILVDTRHGNQVSPEDFEPLSEVLFRAGHTIEFPSAGGTSGPNDDFGPTRGGSTGGVGSSGGSDYNATLEKYDAVIIVQPTSPFSPSELRALQEYTEQGGRVLVMAEPPQIQAGTFTSTRVSFGADNLTRRYGTLVGSQGLFNLDETANDNNFKSIYASPSGGGSLTEGVDTVTFDTAGYAIVREGSDAEVVYRAAEGSTTIETRRAARYSTVVRNGNFALVADTSFLKQSEIYDVDNEVFVGNLLEFLVEGDRPDLVEEETDERPTEDRTTPAPDPGPSPSPSPPPTRTPGN